MRLPLIYCANRTGGKLRRRAGVAGEDGYILLAVLFMVVLVLIALSVAAPKVAADIERDREVELMHRGQQYRRGIQLYFRKFGAYPPNMDALEKTSEIRFLRKRYKDPETGKDEWHLIHFGENKLPTVMGFFGQAMSGTGGSTLAGVGPGGVGQNIGSPVGGISSSGSAFGGSSFGGSGSGIGGSGIGGSGIGGSGIGGSTGTSGTDASGTSGTSGTNGTSGTIGAGGTAGSSTDPSASSGSTGSSIFSGSSTSGSGQTFGGGGIIGVESTSPKLAILEYKKKKHFNEWEFVYDPQQERMQISGNTGTVGQPMSGAGNSTTGSPNSPSLLNNSPGSTFGSPSTGTASPTSPTTSSPQ